MSRIKSLIYEDRISRQAVPILVDDEPHQVTHLDEGIILQVQRELRQIMWQYVSLCRDHNGLVKAKRKLEDLRSLLLPVGKVEHAEGQDVRHQVEIMNMLQVAELVIEAALQRRESRGSHWRRDYETPDEALVSRYYVFQRSSVALGKSVRERAVSHA